MRGGEGVKCFNCKSEAQSNKKQIKTNAFEVVKTETEWKNTLTPEQFYVLRKAGTESPFSSPLNKNYKSGVYHCAACNTALFKSLAQSDPRKIWINDTF